MGRAHGVVAVVARNVSRNMGKIGVSFVDVAIDVSVTSQLGCESVECIGGDFDLGL